MESEKVGKFEKLSFVLRKNLKNRVKSEFEYNEKLGVLKKYCKNEQLSPLIRKSMRGSKKKRVLRIICSVL